MTDKEKIRAEIERRIEELQPCNTRENLRAHGAIAGYYQILSFINSMQEEPVSEDLEEAAVEAFKQIVDSDKNNFLEIFKAGAEWQKQKDSMLVSEDLEEAAHKYADDENPTCPCEECLIKTFKVGAEWGRNQAMAEIQAQSMALAHGCPEENTSNDLKEAADNALESITDQYDIISVGSCLEMFRLGSQWQKEKDQKK